MGRLLRHNKVLLDIDIMVRGMRTHLAGSSACGTTFSRLLSARLLLGMCEPQAANERTSYQQSDKLGRKG